MFFRLAAGAVMMFGMPVCALAVTPEEMEEARTITAKVYLRCSNDGSDYLDKISVKTMSDLEGKLKAKEKENLATFKSLSGGVPSDYASWTKADLINYWSRTFYSNPQIKIDSKGFAQKMTENALGKMKVRDPGEVEQPVPVAADSASALPDAVTTVPMDEQSTQAVLDTLAETVQSVETGENADEGSGNAIYIVLLCVLVAFVVALIIYAARMFKRQSDNDDGDDTEEEQTVTAKSGPNVNVTIAAPAGTRAVADIEQSGGKEVESLRAENAELRRAIDDYKHHLNYVKNEKAELQEQVRQLRAELEQERRTAPTRIPAGYSDRVDVANVYSEEEAVSRSDDRSKTLYLGRANDDGMFVRAERELNSAHSIFRLVSTDGITGTFTVLEMPVVRRRIMADPRMALRGSCDCDFSEADRCSEVENVRGGTAVFDQGRWKVLRRAQVRFL